MPGHDCVPKTHLKHYHDKVFRHPLKKKESGARGPELNSQEIDLLLFHVFDNEVSFIFPNVVYRVSLRFVFCDTNNFGVYSLVLNTMSVRFGCSPYNTEST